MKKVLECYPFTRMIPRVRLVEGFAAYDGVLKDPPGDPHKGIDYTKLVGGIYKTFDVYSAQSGWAFWGGSKTWGRFVLIRGVDHDGVRYDTVYAHLRSINDAIPRLDTPAHSRHSVGRLVEPSFLLGKVGTTGRTHRFNQLHFELHQVHQGQPKPTKLDPYGVDDRASSGRYPQPGDRLEGLDHAWTSDNPPFALEVQ